MDVIMDRFYTHAASCRSEVVKGARYGHRVVLDKVNNKVLMTTLLTYSPLSEI